jgi:predicted component of type VI protein secretion system
MAKLYLKFEQAVLKEVTLSQGVITIGRLPDNVIPIDNLAVSGHHCRIYWENDHYIIEDNSSLNGTYVNNVRTSRAVLHDGDTVLIGKHTLNFKDEWHGDPKPVAKAGVAKPAPKLEATMMLDTKKAREMLAQATAVSSHPHAGDAAGRSTAVNEPVAPPVERTGTLTVVDGKTDMPQYMLTGKMSVIGKSDMASIRLQGWFAPKMAALISRREHHYVIAASEKSVKVVVNGSQIAGQCQLEEGDVIEVAGVKMSFGYKE